MSNDPELSPFSEYPSIPEPVRKALATRFKELTAIQRAVLTPEAEGRNLRLSSQTGSGKTAALGLALAPMLLDKAAEDGKLLALIITPTRELAAQVTSELQWLYSECRSIRIDVVTGGTDLRGEKRRLQKVPRVLVATPGRLLDHIRSGAVNVSHVREVVLDEADQMLDLGFRDDLDAIVAGLPAERRSHLVSATFPASVKQLASRFQSNALQLEGTSLGQANQDIEHIAHLIHDDDRYKAIVNILLSHLGERALVFVRKRTDAAEVAEELANEGFAALPLSGDMAQAQRQRALAAFKSGTVHVLIATDVAARGIHVDDIAVVIHSDIPTDSETYTHRSGRTGRAGNKGCSILLVPARGERRAQRLFQDARVQATFAPLPNPKKIKQRLVKDARRRLHERLLGGAELTQLEYATQLLATNTPEKLVATLLEMSETPLPREPFEINTPTPRQGQARPQSAGGQGSYGGGQGSYGGGQGSGEYSRALITWGIKHGANVNRVLSHICRRSGFSREAFGAIDVGAMTSTVDIRAEVAGEFFQKVSKPDERDPAVRITPLAAGQHVSARSQGGAGAGAGAGRPMRAQGRGFADAGPAANSGPARRKHTIKTGKFSDRRGSSQE